ncbi:crossover junction endodeoxyribonuclease RuvC [Pseudonocardia tropica]
MRIRGEGDAVRVLGVDPGLTRCGIGVVEAGAGRTVGFVAVGVARSQPGLPLERRLLTVADEVERWVDRHRPDVIAVERVFSQNNVRTVMGTAQVSGVVALVAARAGLPVAFHTPSEVKAAVTGEGRAGKAQVTAMVTRLLGLDAPPKPADAADALALAICHCWRSPMIDRMAQAQARAEELAAVHRARIEQGRPAGGSGRTSAADKWAVAQAEAELRSARGWGNGRPDSHS